MGEIMNSSRREAASVLAALIGIVVLMVSCMDRSSDTSPSRDALGRSPLAVSGKHSCGEGDFLYIGDDADDSVERFDAVTGAYLGQFVTSGSGGLMSPRALIFAKRGGPNSELLVVDQNVGQPFPGEVLRYRRSDGAFLGALVPSSDPNAPFAPRGMVLGKHHILYVADQGDPEHPPRIARFDVRTGEFLGDLDPSGFTGNLRPRGVVFGPDGDLYVSVFNPDDPLDGQILRFDEKTGAFLGVVVDGNNNPGTTEPCGCNLNRPEGLVFGPDGRLYVTSFRADATDTDKILIFEVSNGTGVFVDQIVLDQVGEPRAFAQALLFGPGGDLFVPITMEPPNAGEVRRYDVETKTYDVFVPSAAAGGPLGIPLYLTFGDTDPATLAYKGQGNGCHGE